MRVACTEGVTRWAQVSPPHPAAHLRQRPCRKEGADLGGCVLVVCIDGGARGLMQICAGHLAQERHALVHVLGSNFSDASAMLGLWLGDDFFQSLLQGCCQINCVPVSCRRYKLART